MSDTQSKMALLVMDMQVGGDCCIDGDEEVHRVLLSKVFPRQAEVVQASEWMDKLKAGEST